MFPWFFFQGGMKKINPEWCLLPLCNVFTALQGLRWCFPPDSVGEGWRSSRLYLGPRGKERHAVFYEPWLEINDESCIVLANCDQEKIWLLQKIPNRTFEQTPPNPFKNPPINPPTFYFFTWKGGGVMGESFKQFEGGWRGLLKRPCWTFLRTTGVYVCAHTTSCYFQLCSLGNFWVEKTTQSGASFCFATSSPLFKGSDDVSCPERGWGSSRVYLGPGGKDWQAET